MLPEIPDIPEDPSFRGVVLTGPAGEVTLADATLAYAFVVPPSAAFGPRRLRIRFGERMREVRLDEAPSPFDLAPPPMPRDPADDGDDIAAGSDTLDLAPLALEPGEHAVSVAVGPYASGEVRVRIVGTA